MKIPRLFGSGPRPSLVDEYRWETTQRGVLFTVGNSDKPAAASALSARVASPDIGSLLEQLSQEDFADRDGDQFLIQWPQVYELLRSRAYATSVSALALPPSLALVPRLVSQGSLTDQHFTISIAGWVDNRGRPAVLQAVEGAIVRTGAAMGLLAKPVWQLLDAVAAFADRPPSERTPNETRRHWGKIRRLAVDADAVLDDFLVRSVVVTPETLDIEFRRVAVGGTNVIEILPSFEGAPALWLDTFDRSPSVPEHFNIRTPDGAVHIVLSESVRTVLAQIKKLPGRRAAGQRAEAFLLNPISALGQVAAEVIDVAQFEAAKARAGIQFERFRPRVSHDALGYPGDVGIDIDTPQGDAIQSYRRILVTA